MFTLHVHTVSYLILMLLKLTAKLSMVDCFLLSTFTVLLHSGLAVRLVRTTNLSMMFEYLDVEKKARLPKLSKNGGKRREDF